MAALTPRSPSAKKDKGSRREYIGKSVEYRQGARSRLSATNEYFQHFNNTTTIPAGIAVAGTTPATAVSYGTGLGGTIVASSDDVAGNVYQVSTAGLLWQANRQPLGVPLVFECKVSFNEIASNEFFFGLGPALATTTDYIALSVTSTFTTSTPANGVWVGYSNTPTSGAAATGAGTSANKHVHLVSNNGTDTVVATGGPSAVAASTYYTYRLQVHADGHSVSFVDGALLGKSAVTTATLAATPMCAIAVAAPRTTAAAVMTIDYIYIGGV